MKRPRLLDLYCGGGGIAKGYDEAGFDVTGLDTEPRPRYPYRFVQGNALQPPFDLREFEALHASPPCQHYSKSQNMHASGGNHPDLIAATHALLAASGRPWVIENVSGAPLGYAVMLCGLSFGLNVIRHRWFEASFPLFCPPHDTHPKHLRTGTFSNRRRATIGTGYSTGEQGLVCVAGNNFNKEAGMKAMGIDWPMTRKEVANAIPPIFGRYIGKQLLQVI